MEARWWNCCFVRLLSLVGTLLLAQMVEGLPIGAGRVSDWDELTEGEEDSSPSELIYLENQELIWNHKDHWFEMDMVKDSNMRRVLEGATSELGAGDGQEGNTSKRGATSFPQLLWPDAQVPYIFDGFVGRESREVVRLAMDHWEENTCIRFVPRDKQKDYVVFVEMYGCWSYVGKRGGSQMLSLGDNDASFCRRPGVIVHELGHAIGFYHEQSRPDRDDYVMVIWENIIPRAYNNFLKYPRSLIDSREVEYDYSSIMHYPADAFTLDGNWTIVPRHPEEVIGMGQRRRLSPLDIQQANIMYNCLDGGGEDGGVAIRKPKDAFQIKFWNTTLCLSMTREEGEGGPHVHWNQTVISECNASAADQYWKWSSNGSDQLLHADTLLCLSSAKDHRLILQSCGARDATQQWFCAGSYLQQRSRGECVTSAESIKEQTLEEALDGMVDPNETSERSATFATLRRCTSGDARQWLTAINVTVTKREPQTLCTHVPSHVLPRCYTQEETVPPNSNGTWVSCDSIAYYSKAFHLGNETTAAMQCCATSDVFTGQPEGPSMAATEECTEEGWHSFVDATAFEGGFQCPEGLFLKGVLFSLEEGVMAVRCCRSTSRPQEYDHCFMDMDVHRTEHRISACSLPAYRITAVQKTNCDSMECVEENMCCV